MSFVLSGTIHREAGRLGPVAHYANLLVIASLSNSVWIQFTFLLTAGLASLSGYDLYAVVLGLGILTSDRIFTCVSPGEPRTTSNKHSQEQWLNPSVPDLMSAMSLSSGYPDRSGATVIPMPTASLYCAALTRCVPGVLWGGLGPTVTKYHSCWP